MSGYSFNFSFIWKNFDVVLLGLLTSLKLAVLALPLAAALGLLLAILHTDGNRLGRTVVACYVETIRNAPLLLWVYIVFYGLPQLTGIRFDRVPSFLITLAAYGAAYLVEVFRSGLEAIPRGQIEAARAIGLRPWQVLAYVRLPMMLRIVAPALINSCISLFKDTSIAMVLGIPELAFTAQWINTSTFRIVEAWLVILPMYLVTTYAIILGLRYLSSRIGPAGA